MTDDAGIPLADIEVSAYVDGATGWQLATFGETGSDGTYQLDGLADGTYRVLFRDWSQTYAFQYHPGVGSIDDAWDVTVTSGGAVVDAALPPGGRITGVMTDGAGAPLEYPIVFVYSSGNAPEVLFVGQVDEPSGIYEVGGLPTGDYHMMFSGRRGTASWTEYFDDAIRLSDATPISVTAGATTSGIDAQLGPPPGGYPGGLEGVVSATDGTPLPGIEVSVYAGVGPGEWTLVSYQATDADGAFAFLDLPADTYTLGFRDWNQVYAFTYWGGVDRVDAAVPIEVDGDVLLTDMTLDLGARISGRLTDPAGDPLDHAMVFVHTTDDPPQVLFLTNPDPATGDYQLGGLPTGDYLVQFSGWQGLDSYVGYYDGAASIDLAQPVPVTLGEVTAGIDGELGIPPGGVIAGRITDPYGRSFDFARVQAFRDEGDSWVLSGEAETIFYESGYELPLPPGTYRLRFEGGSFLQPDLPAAEVFDDVLTLDEGTDVEVVLDQRIEDFDVTVGNLATGSLAGTVTDAGTGAPLSGIEVWVADRRGRVLYDQIATTDATGAYRVDGLWPERYTVELYDPGYTYQTQVVGQVLVGEDPVVGVDGSLDLATPGTLPGAITGTVRNDGGQPLFGVRVSASSLDGTSFGAALTDSAGRYRVRDLPSGQYEVRFASRDGFQVTELFDDVTDPDAATPVAVAMAATTAGIDAELAPAGIVTGSITNRFGNPFQIATAIVYEDVGGEWSQVATTSVVSDSEYRIEGVPVGTYRVQLIGRSFFGGTALTEYFDDAPAIELGTDVEVVAGEVTAGISGSLGQGPPGAIAGTVTDGAGTPLEGILVRVYDEGFELEAETVTGPDGGYEVPDLYRGRYSVEFTDPQGVYPGEVYDNVAGLDLATPVLVDDAPVTGIDAALDGAGTGPGGGGIRGVVTDAATGAGIEGIRVTCVDELFSFLLDCSTHTTTDGSYQLGGFLTSGSYVVRFSAPNGGWVEEWYDDVRPPLQPTPVTVTEGAWTEGVDAALEPAGAISGTVTNEGGGEFSRLTVTAFRFDGGSWQPFDGTTVIYDSQYELGGLPAGTYRVRFQGGPLFNPDLGIVEFYDDALTVDDGTDVTVVVGQTTAGIDAVLEPRGPGSISGLVTDAAGSGLAGIEVRVYDDEFVLDETVTTAADGSYLIDDLFSGRYSVEFVDPTGTYPSEAYDNVASIDLATPVLVGQGPTAGIDAVLDGPGSGPGGGGIRGVVTDAATGAGIEAIQVRCVDEFFGLVDGCSTTTGADGRYQLGGFLPTGSYLVEFRASDGFYAEEWYDNVRPPLQPTPVAVVEGAWTDGVDAALEPAGGISGTVTNEGGNGYSRTTVTAFRQAGSSWVEYARTDLFYDTEYELRGLPEGTYRIKFRGGSIFNPSYGVEEFFDDVGSIDLATDVEVAIGVVTPGISAVLGDPGGGGELTNPSFDTGLDGWNVGSSVGASAHHGSPDVGGSALSGSLEITADGSAPPTVTVSQCLPIDADSVVDFGAWSQVTGAAASSSAISVTLEIYDDIDCSGELLTDAMSAPRTGAHDWSSAVGSAVVPTGAQAGRLSLTVAAATPGELAVNWDEAFVERATDAVFADGFESGSTGAWSAATP